MQALVDFLTAIGDRLDITLFHLGGRDLNLGTVVYLLLAILLLFPFASLIRRWVAERILKRTNMDIGLRYAIGTVVRYTVIALGFMVILQTTGIDLTALSVLAGAVGIGVGLGLQNIANNLISGLILLFERPIKIGDRIEVGQVNGVVTAINARSTSVVTNDNIAIIIPNSKLVSENVINWSYTDERVRVRVPVGVSYGTDIALMRRIILSVAEDNTNILPAPTPNIRFLGFGESSLDFHVLVWTQTMIHSPLDLSSALYYEILERFRKEGVQIPFPQRDLHLHSTPEAFLGGVSPSE